MVVKTRSYDSKFLTGTRYFGSYLEDPSHSYEGDTLSHVSFNNFVTADYPEDRDWRRLISESKYAGTFLSGTHRSFSTSKHLVDVRDILKLPTRGMVPKPLYGYYVLQYPGAVEGPYDYNVECYSLPANLQSASGTGGQEANLFSSVNNQALQRYSKGVISAQRSFQGLVFGGELRETVGLLTKNGKRVRKSVDGHVERILKKGYLKRFRTLNALRTSLSDLWLEYVFGIKPLLGDIDDSMKALSDVLNRKVPDVKVTRSATGLSRVVNAGFDILPSGLVVGWNCPRVTVSYGYYVKYFGSVHCPNFGSHNVLSRFGLSWSDVLPAVYELIPYSFLIDYFTNLGSVIDAYSHGRASLSWTQRTVIFCRESYVNDVVAFKRSAGLNQWVAFQCPPGDTLYYRYRTVSRDLYTGSIIPDLSFGLPGSLKWLNIAALAASRGRIKQSLLRI